MAVMPLAIESRPLPSDRATDASLQLQPDLSLGSLHVGRSGAGIRLDRGVTHENSVQWIL